MTSGFELNEWNFVLDLLKIIPNEEGTVRITGVSEYHERTILISIDINDILKYELLQNSIDQEGL